MKRLKEYDVAKRNIRKLMVLICFMVVKILIADNKTLKYR